MRAGLKKKIAITISASMAFGFFIKPSHAHWAGDIISKWQNLGIIEKQYLRPDEKITRAEFINYYNEAMGYSVPSFINFSDVSRTDWFYKDVATAISKGYVSGYTDNTFRPYNNVTRAEAAAMLTNGNISTSILSGVSDYKKIPSWATGAVATSLSKGYMSLYSDKTFKPNSLVTKAEAIVMLDKLAGENPKGKPQEKVSISANNGLVIPRNTNLKEQIPSDTTNSTLTTRRDILNVNNQISTNTPSLVVRPYYYYGDNYYGYYYDRFGNRYPYSRYDVSGNRTYFDDRDYRYWNDYYRNNKYDSFYYGHDGFYYDRFGYRYYYDKDGYYYDMDGKRYNPDGTRKYDDINETPLDPGTKINPPITPNPTTPTTPTNPSNPTKPTIPKNPSRPTPAPTTKPITGDPKEIFNFDGTSGTILGFKSGVTIIGNSLTIPEKIGDVTITKIAEKAFAGSFIKKGQLTSVSIPPSVTSIGNLAFANNNISTVDFKTAKKTETITDPVTGAATQKTTNYSNLKNIGNDAFYGNNITVVNFPDGLENIGDAAFAKNSITGEIKIPSTVTNIGIRAFEGNKISGNLIIPNGVKILREFSFAHNSGITTALVSDDAIVDSTTFDSSTTVLRKSAYDKLQEEKKAAEEAAKKAAEEAAAKAEAEKIAAENAAKYTVDPSGVITGYSGGDKDTVTELTIPSSKDGIVIKSIAPNAFAGTQTKPGKLTKVTIPKTITTIGDNAFAYNQIESLDIPNSIATIGENSFGNNQITAVNIPQDSKLTTIGNSAFINNQITNVTLPNSVTSIGRNAFANNEISTLTLSSSLTEIMDLAFSKNALEAITFPDGLSNIGAKAFADNNLNGIITIPGSVTNIGGDAFLGNDSITEIILKEKPSTYNVDMIGLPATAKITYKNTQTTP